MAITALDRRIFENNFYINREVQRKTDDRKLDDLEYQRTLNMQTSLRNDESNLIAARNELLRRDDTDLAIRNSNLRRADDMVAIRNEEIRRAENNRIIRNADNELAIRRAADDLRRAENERFTREIDIQDSLELSDRRTLGVQIGESLLG